MAKFNINYKGLKVIVIGCDERDIAVLEAQFKRLAIHADFISTLVEEKEFERYNLIFIDADNHDLFNPNVIIPWPNKIAKIVINSIETPSRLKWILKQEVDSFLTKPIKFSGILTGITIAMDNKLIKNKMKQRIIELEDKVKLRKYVIEVETYIMDKLKVNEEQAYLYIRKAAMFKQLTIENFCVEFLKNKEDYLNFAYSL